MTFQLAFPKARIYPVAVSERIFSPLGSRLLGCAPVSASTLVGAFVLVVLGIRAVCPYANETQ